MRQVIIGLVFVQNQEDYEGERPYFERVLAIFTVRLGDAHPHTRIVHNNLARLLEQINQASS